MATLSRGIGNELRKPRNRLVVLSWNLQNFTGDQRCGRSNGQIGSDRNRVRAAFVACVMRAVQANALLVMETGSDVGQALESIRRHAGDAFHPFQSERTHETPPIRSSHVIPSRFVRVGDAWELRKLCSTFTITPGAPRAVDERVACDLLFKSRAVFDTPVPEGDLILRFETHARQKADSWLLLGGARSLLRGPPTTVDDLVDLVDDLRYLRLHAREGANPAVFLATEHLELAHLCRFHSLSGRGERPPIDAAAIRRLVASGPDSPRLRHEKNLPLSLFLLLAFAGLRLDVADASSVHELDDARMVYDALQHFECVEFHFETYGVLLDRDAIRMEPFLSSERHFSVMRFDADGHLLGTQKEGSSYNWRSALRMLLPLAGGQWIEALLFHTRFTPSRAVLEEKGSDMTQKERTYRMRAAGIEEIGALLAQHQPTGLPIAFFGDFNLPMTEASDELSRFAASMSKLGFARLPASCPATTLRALPTLTQDPDATYSQAYDGLYAHGFSDGQVACRALDLKDLLALMSPEVLELLRPAVIAYYKGQVNRLRARFGDQITQLGRVRAGGPDWLKIVGHCVALRDPPAFDAEIVRLLPGCDAFTIPKAGDLLGSLLTRLQGEVDTAIKSTEYQSLPARLQHLLGRVLGDLRDGAVVFTALETNAEVRFAVAYESAVSDHLPLLATIDLDGPVASSSTMGPSAPPPSSPFGFGAPLSLGMALVPRNVEEFLTQQGRGAPEIQNFRDFLATNHLREGTASSDINVCLLHTVGQIVLDAERGEDVVPDVSKAVGVAPGPMQEITSAKFTGFLNERGVDVQVWTLNIDGTVSPHTRVGRPGGRPAHVLYYGAHYVPLWRTA